jgi:hypothetical protein
MWHVCNTVNAENEKIMTHVEYFAFQQKRPDLDLPCWNCLHKRAKGRVRRFTPDDFATRCMATLMRGDGDAWYTTAWGHADLYSPLSPKPNGLGYYREFTAGSLPGLRTGDLTA